MSVATLHRLPSLRSLAATPHRGLVEVATIIGLYGFYEVVRGQGHATLGVAREHTDGIVALERHLHLFGERTVQRAAHWVPALPTLLGIAYIALHFLGTAAFLIWLHRTHPERFSVVRNTLIAATGVALSIYLLYPVAPPRLAGLGFVDTVTHNAKVNLSSDLLGIVATGNHFFFDAAGGALAIGIGYVAASWVDSPAKPAERWQPDRQSAA